MIENVSDFFKNVKERLASPFFISFIISWTLINWRVTVALIWYNSDLYPKSGDLIRFIECNFIEYSTLFSIGFALVYTGLIRNAISALVAYSASWGGDLNLRLSKDSNVPMSKFLTYKDLHTKSRKSLEKIIKDESKTIENYDKEHAMVLSLETKIVEFTNQKNQLEKDLKDMKDAESKLVQKINSNQIDLTELKMYKNRTNDFVEKYNDVKILDGRWKFNYRNNSTNINFSETIEIFDGLFFSIDDEGRSVSTLQITYFFNDELTGKILLLLEFVPNTSEANFLNKGRLTLDIPDDVSSKLSIAFQRTKNLSTIIQKLEKQGDILSGKENLEGIIRYEFLGKTRVIGAKGI